MSFIVVCAILSLVHPQAVRATKPLIAFIAEQMEQVPHIGLYR